MSGCVAPRTFASLESLRGIAALAVVLHHVSWTNIVADLPFFRNSYLMVDFFFVLSGFVIFHTYSDRMSSPTALLRFIWLRLGRLYPLHLFMLLVFLGIEVIKLLAERFAPLGGASPSFSGNDLRSFLANLMLMQSWGVCEYHTWNIASWSISVEFLLYLVFGLLVLLCVPMGRLFGLLAAPLIAGSAMYLLAQHSHEPSQYVDILRGVSGFFAGVWICTLRRSVPWLQDTAASPWSAANLAAIGAAAAAVGCLSLAGWGAVPLIYPVFAVLLLASSCLSPGAGINRLLTLRPLLWLGKVSYSIYMVHQAMFWGVRQVLRVLLKAPTIETTGGLQFVVPFWLSNLLLLTVIGLVLLCSGWTYRHIEERFRRKARALADRHAAEAAAPHLARGGTA